MDLFFKKRKKAYSFKEKVIIVVLLAVIVGANTVTIVKAASTWDSSDSASLVLVNPNGLVGCQAQPGFKCGEQNGKRVNIGFYPDLEAIYRAIGVYDSWVNTMLTQQVGSEPCALGRAVVEGFSNVVNTSAKSCWTIKYRCVSFCEPPDSGGKNSIPCSVTLCKDNVSVEPVSTDPNNQVLPSTK